MKNSSRGLLMLLLMGLFSGNCKKQLNGFPSNDNVDGNIITNQQTAQVVLNGVYYRFANAGVDGVLSTQWSAINEHFPSELAGSLSVRGFDSISTLTFSADFYLIDPIWVYGYNLVNAANGFIKNAAPVTSIPGAAKQQMMAEARFLKAFGNSNLLFYFGQYNDISSKYGIVLRDTFTIAASVNLPRSGVAAAYTSIVDDLDVAIRGLPALNSAIYYANASDAKLLKARVLMNRGAAGDYDQVISLTNDIITNGPFALEDSVKDIFLTNGFASKEVMLAIQPYSNESYKWFFYVENSWVATDNFINLLANDARNKWVYKTIVGRFSSTRQLTKYYTGNPSEPVQTPLSNNCYAFRLSEAYLLEAEAMALSNGDITTAKTLLKTVLSHAGAGSEEFAAVDSAVTPAALQVEIVKEYLRNFVIENGTDWLALRRLPFATIQQLNRNIKDPSRLLLPIPSSEINLNNSIIQNPGY